MKTANAGILLAQLGTPDSPTPAALRRFLREFLGDPRVIEVSRPLWWLILHCFILPFRPARSAALYRRVWTEGGSPLLLATLEQARGLQAGLGNQVRVEAGMRYGNPSIPAALDSLCRAGADRILVFPMFPQYSAATTGSVFDAVSAHFQGRRVVPALRFVPPFPDHPAYLEALATVAREALARMDPQPEKLLVSFHGLPERYVARGDPYRSHAEETARGLAGRLGLPAEDHILCFQSRFGREEWLKPYTVDVLAELAKAGVKRVAAMCPGFVADCLETIDEIGHEGKKLFVEAGGEDLQLIPCLNAHPAWIDAMAFIAREELSGWLPRG